MPTNKNYRNYKPKRPISNTRKIDTQHINRELLNRKKYIAAKKRRKNRASNMSIALVFGSIVAVLVLIFFSLRMLRPEHTEAETVKSVSIVETELTNESATTTTTVASTEITTTEAPTTEQETLIADPPIMYGISPITAYVGRPVSYKNGIYMYSEVDDTPTLQVDNKEVDLFTPGVYQVTYTASDRYGNSASQVTTLTVLEGEEVIEEATIKELAKTILDSIIEDEDMADEYKCLEVYKYLHTIGYVDTVYSEDWMQNAYWMLHDRAGDCFGYYAAARLLLTELGYDVIEIENNNGFTHYWCLVSIDKGKTWWHFDATCWSWGEDGVLCLVSDKYITEYAERHLVGRNTSNHSWDRDKYPKTPEEDFWTDEERDIIYIGGWMPIGPNGDFNAWDSWEEWEPEFWEDTENGYENTEDGSVEEPEDPSYEEPPYEEPEDPYYEEPPYEEPEDPYYEEPPYEEPGDPSYEEPPYEEPPYDGEYVEE